MTASDIDRLATAHVALTNRLLSDSYWYEDFMTGVASLLALAAQSFAAVAVEQADLATANAFMAEGFNRQRNEQKARADGAEKELRRLQNRDADAALLAVANARGTCGECYYNRKCSIQDAARAGDAFYCAAFEQKDEGPYDAPVSSDFLP